jgi:hypothetical protein
MGYYTFTKDKNFKVISRKTFHELHYSFSVDQTHYLGSDEKLVVKDCVNFIDFIKLKSKRDEDKCSNLQHPREL